MELRQTQTRTAEGELLDWTEALGSETRAETGMTNLETKLCEYNGVPYSIAVDSATTGLLLALKAAGIENGVPVLCTSFSYFATAEIIELAGGRPMFVDINPNTYCIDPYCLEYVIGKCVRRKLPIPKALIAVDLFGQPCNYESLEAICEKHGIILIEDMAQSFGATYGGRKAGSFGRMAVASFFPAKPLGELGEGGAVFCHSAEDALRLRSLRHNISLGSTGQASFLDRVQASIATEKLASFDLELERRRGIAERYRQRLEGSVKLQQISDSCQSAYTHFVISMKNARLREGMIERLQLCHIPCSIFEPSPVGRRESSALDKVALVNAQSVAQRILCVPMHPYLSGHVVDYICDRILDEAASPGTALEDLMAVDVLDESESIVPE